MTPSDLTQSPSTEESMEIDPLPLEERDGTQAQ